MEVASYYPTELQMAPEGMQMPPSERRPMQPMEIENGQAHPQKHKKKSKLWLWLVLGGVGLAIVAVVIIYAIAPAASSAGKTLKSFMNILMWLGIASVLPMLLAGAYKGYKAIKGKEEEGAKDSMDPAMTDSMTDSMTDGTDGVDGVDGTGTGEGSLNALVLSYATVDPEVADLLTKEEEEQAKEKSL